MLKTTLLALAALTSAAQAQTIERPEGGAPDGLFGVLTVGQTTMSPYLSLPDLADGTVVELDSTSALHRSRTGVGYTASVRGLEPGAAYTNWFVAFTRPDRCETACACGLADLSNPDAEVGVYYATGRVADDYGQATFSSETDYGELPDGEDQVPLAGLENPVTLRSEVHLVVRRHDRAAVDDLLREAQLTTFNAGCPAGGCVDEQVSVHRSPSCRAPRTRGRRR